MQVFQSIKTWARRIKRDSVTLWFAYRDPQTPFLVKSLCIFVVAYALSPIDLVPDFIPILGYIDDVILLPGLIWLSIRLLPKDVIERSRLQADAWIVQQGKRPTSCVGAAAIVAIWVLISYAAWRWFSGWAAP